MLLATSWKKEHQAADKPNHHPQTHKSGQKDIALSYVRAA
jgi:hypothetical protein